MSDVRCLKGPLPCLLHRKKLTVRKVQDRVKEILARHSDACGKSSWIDPEGVQGLIDDLREAAIQAIAAGSKVPYALTRCIAELPRVHYGTIPTEPVHTPVTKIAASSMYGKSPCVDCHESMELDENDRCCHCATHRPKSSPSSVMTDEQSYAIREIIGGNIQANDGYPPGLSPYALREAFDRLLEEHETMKCALRGISKCMNLVASDRLLRTDNR